MGREGGAAEHRTMVCPTCSRLEGSQVVCQHLTDEAGLPHSRPFVDWSHFIDEMLIGFKDMRPVTGKRVGDIEVGAEHYAAIDELAKWCIMKTTDMDLGAAGRAWVLYRLDVPTMEAAPEE